jgi:tetratricopeptide (TPR) repeat protein
MPNPAKPDKLQDDDLVMNLVDLALARPSGEREAYLRTVCGNDTRLFDKVLSYVVWEERMSGFLLDPLFPPLEPEHVFEPGDLLRGRFRIVREVAQGGMGIVYEARDEKLDRRIAVKCAKTGFHKRLGPEVRNARDISHPNVCKIYEIHSAPVRGDEVEFIAMEFLDGQTLTERLLEGSMPKEETGAFAEQLAAGLAEAHRNNVVHGDLKTSNVILTKSADGSARAVITDFGLARQPKASQPGTPSDVMGAPDYMAPELWKGEKPSMASDVYALGVILYELACGRTPFGPDVSLEERLTRRPAAIRHKWNRVLMRCLEPNPAKRFRHGSEVAEALEPRQARRWAFTAAAAVIAIAAASGLATFRNGTAPPEAVRLAVLPFESTGETAALAGRVFRDTADVIAGLKGNSRVSVSVAPVEAVVGQRVDSAQKAREILGATHTVRALLNQRDGNLVLHAYLADARAQVTAKEWTVEYAPPEMRYAPVALAGFVTGTLRLPPLLASAAVNQAARQDYDAGVAALRWNSTVDTALINFERAVHADPDSALAFAGLAEARWLKFYVTKDRQWQDRSAEALQEALRRNPDLGPVHRMSGLLEANAGRHERAVVEYLRAIELEPLNGDNYRRLGQSYEQNSQLEQALTMFQKGVEIEPNYFRVYQELGAYYYNHSQPAEAVKYLSRMVTLAPQEPVAHFALGSAYYNWGHFPEAERELRTALSLGETPNIVLNLSVALIYQDKCPEAIQYLSQGLRKWPNEYLMWMNLGICYQWTNSPGNAEQAFQHGLAYVEKEITQNPRDGRIRSHMAFMFAGSGDRRRAEFEIAQALQQSPSDANVRWMAVLTYEALGRREDALRVLASSPDGVLADVSRWTGVADLHKDSRFVQLLTARQIK